jgi:hypothetical protein
MAKIEWRDIPNFENFYKISNTGLIKSLERIIKTKNNKSKTVKEKILKGSLTNNGYKQVILYKNGKSKRFAIHKLVAICFLNHIPCGMNIVIDHIDGNKLNNNVSNLREVTHRENLSKRKTSSQYPGVYFNKKLKKWHAQISINYKRVHLGYFNDEKEAYKAYVSYLQKLKTN